MHVMALDVGTSSTRAICFGADGLPVAGAEGRVSYEPVTTPDGGAELDADALVDAVAAAVDQCLAGAAARRLDVAAVGASVFWHSLLALDGAGSPLTGVITWADTRSSGAAAALRGLLDERPVHARTGAPIHSAFFPAKLRWLRQTRPDVFARARTWCGFAEYLLGRLTGTLRVSLSMASGTGLLDQRTGRWDPEMLRVCDIGIERLPDIDDRPVSGLSARMRSRWPGLAGARWHPGRGDGACSNLGSDCAGPDRIALNVGTSAAMRVVTPVSAAGPDATPWGLWRYRVDAERALVGGATSEGGNVIAWCRRVLALPADDAAFERAVAGVPPGAEGLVALPFLAGERSVGWRGDARGALTGLGLNATPAHIARALMESVAARLALVYALLIPLAGSGHAVVASGGALMRSRTWASIVADTLGVPLALAGEAEASARGAALVALAAEGAPAPAPLPAAGAIAPDLGRHEAYRQLGERQREVYRAILGPARLS